MGGAYLSTAHDRSPETQPEPRALAAVTARSCPGREAKPLASSCSARFSFFRWKECCVKSVTCPDLADLS